MRVLKVSDVHFPRVNGVSTSIETFRRALPEFGVEVRLVVPRYGQEEEACGVTRVSGRPVPRDPEDRLVHWGAMHRAVRLAAGDCHLIHAQTPFIAHPASVKAARALGLPVVATYHTLFEEYLQHYAPFLPGSWLRALARQVSRRQCNALDAVIVPSCAMKERLTAYGVTSPIHVLPTGIPLSRFSGGERARFRATHGIAPERPVILYVGRVAFEKNIGFLLDTFALALEKRPDLLFLITGHGPAVPELKARAERLGVAHAVRFLGYLDRDGELQDCYAAADAFVFASRTETQGLVLLEAMAMGLPVVALAEMGTVDILAPGLGCVVPRHDTEDFAAVLLELLSAPERCRRLAAEARHHALSWSDTAMAGRLAQLYRQIITDTTIWKRA
ncbi:MAG: glycosyltransferase [Rhodocyclaceae bacterium]|nr:glycosyltransferase [Rhodocyclaceae bacterium]